MFYDFTKSQKIEKSEADFPTKVQGGQNVSLWWNRQRKHILSQERSVLHDGSLPGSLPHEGVGLHILAARHRLCNDLLHRSDRPGKKTKEKWFNGTVQ